MFARIGSFLLSANTSLHVIGLMAFLPFIVIWHRLPIPSFYGEWLAAVLGLVALLPLLKRESWQPLELPQVSLIFPGLIAIVLIQWMLGMLHSWQYALLAASYLAGAFLLVVLGCHLRRQLGWKKVVSTMAWAVLLGGLFNSVLVLLQYATKSGMATGWLPELSGYGALAQPNHFADYMAIATASLIYLLAKKRLPLTLAVALGVLFLSVLAFSGSRSSWLYIGAIALLAFVLRAIAIRQQSSTSALQMQQSRSVFRWALMTLPVFALVQWLIFLLAGEAVTLPTQRLLGETAAVSGWAARLHIWQESWQIFMNAQFPWLGIGVGQTRWQSFLYLGEHHVAGMPGMFEHAHNLLLHLLLEMGPFALLLLLAGMVAWLRNFQWRNIQLENWWLLTVLAIIGIHSMLEYPLWYAYFLGLFAILLGAGDEKTTQLRTAFSGRVALAALMLAGVAILATLQIGNHKLEHWLDRAASGEITRQQYVEYTQAMAWVYKQTLLSPYVELIYASSLIPDIKRLPEKRWLSQSAMRFLPMRSNAYRHVLLLDLNGERDAAVLYLRRALQAFPGNFRDQLQQIPMHHWERYLETLTLAAPPQPAAARAEK